jgi:hypothetical protein
MFFTPEILIRSIPRKGATAAASAATAAAE